MNDRIGIDTHGYDEPPDVPEPTQSELDEMSDIEEQINELVGKYQKIAGWHPDIHGYYTLEEAGRLLRRMERKAQ